MADAAFLKAQRARSPKLRAEYFNMATGWHSLAQEIERTVNDLERSGVSPEPILAENKPTN
jgi:hypothetical protein